MKMETNGHHHNVSNGNLPEDHAKDDDLEDEEILAEDNEWNQFDEIIGCIEDIVIEKQFQDLQESFLEKHYHHFEIGTEENKLIYMELFQEYTKMLEEFIEGELEQRIENFCMKDFIKELEERKLDLEGEVFDMLFTLTDFLAFKEMFLDYKLTQTQSSANEGLPALQDILSVTSL